VAWFSRFTRFGDLHLVFGQERNIACGLACVIMAAFKVNKLQPGVRAMYGEDEIVALATKVLGPNPLGTVGLTGRALLKVLDHPSLKMPGWNLARLPSTSVVSKVIKQVGISRMGLTIHARPMILLVNWKGSGGHWIVIDSVREWSGQLYATVCDPWDAHVHVTRMSRNKTLKYTGDSVFGIDFGGTHYEYDHPSKGSVFLGDVLWQT
jgi:hypothetical protein